MDSEDRAAAHALEFELALRYRPFNFDFFQAVRRIECQHLDKPKIGAAAVPADEPIRFGQRPRLIFAPSTLSTYEPGKQGRPPRLYVHFFGLMGPNGALPFHLTEHAIDRQRDYKDETFTAFLNVFNHRMLEFFYRAWAVASPTVNFDRPDDDKFGEYVGSLVGIGMDSLRARDAMADAAKLHYSGRLAGKTRHPEGLKALLEGFFDMPVEIVEFVGAWMLLPDSCLTLLGGSPEISTLGESTVIGERVWGCHQTFRIMLGPMSAAAYRRLLPGNDSLTRLVSLVRNYAGDELDWDVNLVLRGDEVPSTVLGESGELGWTTWIGDRPPGTDADDLKLRPMLFDDGVVRDANPAMAGFT